VDVGREYAVMPCFFAISHSTEDAVTQAEAPDRISFPLCILRPANQEQGCAQFRIAPVELVVMQQRHARNAFVLMWIAVKCERKYVIQMSNIIPVLTYLIPHVKLA